MRPTTTRRARRRPSATREVGNPQLEHQHERKFFGPGSQEPFFRPAPLIQRAAEAGPEEEKLKRAPSEEKKEEKLAKAPEEKKEEKLAKAPEEKKEEKLAKAPEEKKEEKLAKAPEEERKDEKKLNKKGDASEPGERTVRYVQSLAGKGEPLPEREQSFYGDRMGVDFGAVRVHTGEEAAASARDAGARAYTYGNHIVFNEGRYDTESHEGRRLLAHELTHVVQHGGAPGRAQAPAHAGPATAKVGPAPAGKAGRTVQRGFWSDAWDVVSGVGSAIWGGVEAVGSWGWDVLKSAGAWVWDFVTWLPSRVWSLLTHIGSGIVGLVSHLWGGLVGALGHIWDGLTGLFSWLGDGVAGLFGWIWRGLSGTGSWAWRLLNGDFSAVWDGFGDALSWLGDGVSGLFVWGWRGVEGAAIWAWRGLGGLARWCWDALLGGAAWIGRFIAKIFDILGLGEAWTLFWNILKGFSTRTLTDVEQSEASKVFAGSIAYWQVRIDEMSLIAKIGAWGQGSSGMGVTTGHTINFNHEIHCAAGNSDMAWLIHELGHVAQYTHVGLQYLGEAIHAQATGGYDYGGGGALVGKNFADFNREQQCDILRDYYRLVVVGGGLDAHSAEYTRMRDQAVAGEF